MSTDDLQDTIDPDQQDETVEPLTLEVQVEKPSACQRHVIVTIAREDVDRYFDDAFSEMMDTAAVPGFRPGRAPRKLIEARYRKEATEQIKGSLLMDSMAQVNEEQQFAAISEPDIKLDAIEVPAEGPMTFEFDLEVRPEFDLPEWKGLTIEQQAAEFTDVDINRHLRSMLDSYGRLVPTGDPAGEGDHLTVNIAAESDGQVLHRTAEQSVCIQPTLSFRDGKMENFDKLMAGVTTGETREATMTLSADAPNEAWAGKQVNVKFEVLDVKKFEPPELTDDLLEELGGFEGEGDLRDGVRNNLERQLEYNQRQRARQQITNLLTEAATWELPPELLERQSSRELERATLELRRSGFSESDVRAYSNDLRQNSREKTAQALREHFILERIAEEEEIDADDNDYEREITLIAMQSGDTPRRVRAQIEKQNLMDALRNQIIERKVMDAVLEHANFKQVKFQPEGGEVAAVDVAVGGGDQSNIPVAEHGESEPLAAPKDHT